MMERRAQKASAPSRRLGSAGDAACRTLGGSIDLPRLDGQRGADAVSSSVDLVMQRRLAATAASVPDATFPEKVTKTLSPDPIKLVSSGPKLLCSFFFLWFGFYRSGEFPSKNTPSIISIAIVFICFNL